MLRIDPVPAPRDGLGRLALEGTAMIRFALRCDNDHRFESWFRSGPAFDALQAGGQVECPVCASRQIEKAPMAPAVSAGKAEPAARSPEATGGVLSAGRDSDVARALDRLRRAIEAGTDDVGRQFADEARAIHEGRAPERAIRGEASADETRALLRDGIPVMPLPFRDPQKAN